jgi:hypothetical protein
VTQQRSPKTPARTTSHPCASVKSQPLAERSCLTETPLSRWLHRKHRTEARRCCVCGIAVKNSNLGGFTGRSALSGRLFCPYCEDSGGCL